MVYDVRFSTVIPAVRRGRRAACCLDVAWGVVCETHSRDSVTDSEPVRQHNTYTFPTFKVYNYSSEIDVHHRAVTVATSRSVRARRYHRSARPPSSTLA